MVSDPHMMAKISWTGEFADPRQEHSFTQGSTQRAMEAARLCVVATTLTSLSFAPLDLMTLPADMLPFFLGDRLLIALLCIIAMTAIIRATSYGRVVALTHLQQYVFFALNALIFNHPVLLRHGGALLPLIAIALFIFLPGGFRATAALTAFAPGISLLFWGVLRPEPEASLDLTIIFLLTLVAYMVGGIARTQFSRMRREEHLHIERERHTNQTLLEAKEAAEAGARTKADFLAVMSHEIRTPMNGVLGMVRLVLESPLPETERSRLQTACQSAEGLQVILDDILDFSKLEAGRLEFEDAPFHLRSTLEGVIALMELRAQDKGLALTLNIAPSLPDWVAGDSGRLRQILFNLIGNAVKFTQTGSVNIRADRLDDGGDDIRVEFSVTDTGPGIDTQQRARLFLPFSQADASISRQFGGTGLGLIICKRLVEGLGGDIDVDSTLGRGSRFHFRLGFATAEQPPDELSPTPQSSLPPLSVLLAEDHPVNQLVAQGLLESAGHRVTLAVNGAQAVDLARDGGFDLILMDMQMPEVDGLEATRRIRTLPAPAGMVPIIALTANVMPGDAARCRAAGMNGHLAKPVERRTLDAAMAQVVGGPTISIDVLMVGEDGNGLRRRLTTLGHRVFPVADTVIAANLLRARPFDLIVALTKQARADCVIRLRQTIPHPPPILAYAPDESEQPCGADAVLTADSPVSAWAITIAGLCPEGQDRNDTDTGDTVAALETLLGRDQMIRVHTLLATSLDEHAAILAADAIAAKDLAATAHRIKGSAATLGLTALAMAAEQAMMEAEQGDT
ncbi:MAG: ATP-binding protein, partial [Rhodospirillales bacterium]